MNECPCCKQPLPDWTEGKALVDLMSNTLVFGGKQIALSPREADVLYVLAARGGAYVSVDSLLQSVWGLDQPKTHCAVQVQMTALRKKIGSVGLTIQSSVHGGQIGRYGNYRLVLPQT